MEKWDWRDKKELKAKVWGQTSENGFSIYPCDLISSCPQQSFIVNKQMFHGQWELVNICLRWLRCLYNGLKWWWRGRLCNIVIAVVEHLTGWQHRHRAFTVMSSKTHQLLNGRLMKLSTSTQEVTSLCLHLTCYLILAAKANTLGLWNAWFTDMEVLTTSLQAEGHIL